MFIIVLGKPCPFHPDLIQAHSNSSPGTIKCSVRGSRTPSFPSSGAFVPRKSPPTITPPPPHPTHPPCKTSKGFWALHFARAFWTDPHWGGLLWAAFFLTIANKLKKFIGENRVFFGREVFKNSILRGYHWNYPLQNEQTKRHHQKYVWSQ